MPWAKEGVTVHNTNFYRNLSIADPQARAFRAAAAGRVGSHIETRWGQREGEAVNAKGGNTAVNRLPPPTHVEIRQPIRKAVRQQSGGARRRDSSAQRRGAPIGIDRSPVRSLGRTPGSSPHSGRPTRALARRGLAIAVAASRLLRAPGGIWLDICPPRFPRSLLRSPSC